MPLLTLANMVRARRESLGLSRPALADASGISVSTVVRIELQGHVPSVRVLAAVASVLDLPIAALVDAAEGVAA